MNKAFTGKAGTKATIICDSVCAHSGARLTTFELEYSRIVHNELLTHRMLSKNSSSSRAIPFAKMLEQLKGVPVSFGANQAGMQAGAEHSEPVWSGVGVGNEQVKTYYTPLESWTEARISASKWAARFSDAGYHKQICNRLVEPFQMMRTVISGTEWNNFFWLRNHEAADPSLHELARVMFEAYESSKPQVLQPGEWHLPYVDCDFSVAPVGGFACFPDKPSPYSIVVGNPAAEVPLHQLLSLEEAIKVSCARCCAVSYRNEGYGLVKSLEVFEKLVDSDRVHGSATEHCATPVKEAAWWNSGSRCFHEGPNINLPEKPSTWQPGISHADRQGNLWSGNFRGWIQFRKTVKGENHDG